MKTERTNWCGTCDAQVPMTEIAASEHLHDKKPKNQEKARPTRGPVYFETWSSSVRAKDRINFVKSLATVDREADGELITAAFNAATEVADMGFDPIEAVRMLPMLLQTLQDTLLWAKNAPAPFPSSMLRQALAAARGEEKVGG